MQLPGSFPTNPGGSVAWWRSAFCLDTPRAWLLPGLTWARDSWVGHILALGLCPALCSQVTRSGSVIGPSPSRYEHCFWPHVDSSEQGPNFPLTRQGAPSLVPRGRNGGPRGSAWCDHHLDTHTPLRISQMRAGHLSAVAPQEAPLGPSGPCLPATLASGLLVSLGQR